MNRIGPLMVVGLLLGCGNGSSAQDGQTGSDASGPTKPCPPQGIGVAAASGRLCSEVTDPKDPDLIDCLAQMTNYRQYACDEPQICLGEGYVSMPQVLVGESKTVTVAVTNCSTGSKKLWILNVQMEGDPRCVFEFDPQKDLSPILIAPGESGAVKTVYKPQAEGEDHAAVAIYSDAQNYPGLMLQICGRAVTTAGTSQPLTCVDPAGAVAPCHKP
jgi:hypothetical protein